MTLNEALSYIMYDCAWSDYGQAAIDEIMSRMLSGITDEEKESIRAMQVTARS